MRKTLMAGAALLALGACGGGDTEAEIAETQEEIAAREAAAAAEAAQAEPAPPAEAYLAENAAREGVRVTESGLQIETLEAGEGPSPEATDVLRFTYEVRGQDGVVLDSSEGLGAPVVVGGYENMGLPGLVEAVPQMREGERARITMPPALAFGEQVPPGAGVEPGEAVVFDLDLVEVIKADDEARLEELRAGEQARMEAARADMQAQFDAMVAENVAASESFLAGKRAEDGVQATESGLLYEVVEDGGEGASPAPTDRVRVHYRGTLPNGETFDSSYDRGEPNEFQLNQVIAGWTEGLQLMQPGDTYKFYIPADLAYGERGTPGGPIGPSQALVFDVELLAVVEPTAPAAEAAED